LSVTRPYDPLKARDLAEIVGDSVILNSFIVVSASFGIEELLKISELLSNGPVPDPDDLAETIRADYLKLAESTGNDTAAELLRRRAIRRDRQVWRIATEVEEARKEAYRWREAADLADRLKADNEDLRTENQRLRRVFCLSATEVVIAIGVALSALAGAPVWIVVGSALGCAGVGFEGVKWVRDPTLSAMRFILAIGATISWTLLGSVVGIALSPMPAPHSMRDPVAVTARWASGERLANFSDPGMRWITGGGRGSRPATADHHTS